ncbi:MAG: trigger factor [Xenococcaceae cyanobacterium]
MKVTQEKLPDSKIGLEIEISREISQKTYEKVVQNLARSTNIPGFRKGKVPRQVLLQRLGSKRIKAAALEEIIQTSLSEALTQESIESLGNYQLRSDFDRLLQEYKPGEILTFSASVDVPPSVELGDYHNLKVKAEETAYDPQQVEDFLEEKRAQQADLIPVEDRPAEKGDVAIIDFSGKITVEGEEEREIEGGSATNFQVELVEGKLIPGMVEGVFGMQPEETKEVSVTFPEDYPKEELAGKPAVFSITLKELKTKDLPDLDDDFAADNSEFETLEELKQSLTEQFQEKAANETKSSINEAITTALVDQSTVEIPETLIEEEVTQILTQTLMQMQQMGIDVKQLFNAETVPKMRENARPEAVENLKKSLVIAEVGKRESLQASETEITDKIKEIQEQLAGQEIDQEKLEAMVIKDLNQEKVFDWLREKTEVELVPKGTLAEESSAEAISQEESSESAESNP